ncbi:MAG: ATP-binding protein [Candidatus Woesearchaeota archaeon]
MRLDEIVRKDIRLVYGSLGELLTRNGFDYKLSLVVGEGTYSRDFSIEQRAEIEFILNEYIVNARKAIYGTDEAPYRSSEAERLKTIPCRIEVRLEEKEQGYILSVADNGDGIPPENQPKVFRNQFSTRGTKGMGLKCVLNIASYKLNGHVDFTSEVDKGSTFYLYLPKG